MSRSSNQTPSVLLVDDEPQILRSFSIMLRGAGVKQVITLDNSREVMGLLKERTVSAVVLDLSMPYVSGTELLIEIRHGYPHIPVIIMTATGELETAVECMKAGAFDYLLKPVEITRFETSVMRALEFTALRSEVHALKRHLLMGNLENEEAFSSIVTVSKAMHAIFQYVEVIAASGQPVLITGETGVGKELIARAVHDVSGRRGEFVAVNLAGLDDAVFSDTLFGHRKGAYTGADSNRAGLVARAAGGTLFLDEIGETAESSQIKLLRLLQDNRYYPLGSDVSMLGDVRVVVATNRDLLAAVSDGKFRKDLYYRLRGHQIDVPPLRERPEDIPVLLNHFMHKAAESMKVKVPTAPPELTDLLFTYHFPGNVRELESMVCDAVARHRSGILSMESFREVIGRERSSRGTGAQMDLPYGSPGRIPTLKEAEEGLIARALEASRGNQGIAASLLGITRQALNKRLTRKRPGARTGNA